MITKYIEKILLGFQDEHLHIERSHQQESPSLSAIIDYLPSTN